MFSSLVQTTPQIQSGKLRALGVGGTKPSPILPERSHHRRSRRTGLRGHQLVGYRGAGRRAAGGRRPAAQGDRGGAGREAGPGAFAKEGADVLQMSQAEFAAFMASEMAKWEKVVKASGMKAE